MTTTAGQEISRVSLKDPKRSNASIVNKNLTNENAATKAKTKLKTL